MKNKSLKILLSLTIVSCLLFTACGTDETMNPTTDTSTESVVEPEPTVEPTPEPTVEPTPEATAEPAPDTETEDTSEFDNMTSEEKSEANYNDSQSGNDEEQIFEEEPAEPEVEEPAEPEQPEVEKPSTSGTPGNYNFSAEERQWMKENWGLSDSEIDSMTKERFHELVYMEYGIDLSGSSSTSGGSSSSSGGSSSSGNEDYSEENYGSDLPAFEGVPEEEVVPGRM